tara:strand:+ start:1011 stop:1904 length:894 start_codon:yes stop_codon:yes gene_type:complete
MAAMIEDNYALPNPTHARIGWRDAITAATASSAAEGQGAANAISWQTYERWRPTASPATLTATFDAQTIDYIGVAAHTLRTTDSVALEVRQGGVWSEITTNLVTWPDDNEAIMVLIDPREIDGVRLNITYTGNAPSVGKISAGRVLTMRRPFYSGHNPGMLSRDTTRQPSVSEGGEWLGNTVIRQSRSTGMSWEHIEANWYRINVDPFVQHARGNPFFIAWNPARFIDCLYGMLEGDVSPSNMGIRDLMEFSISVKAYSDGTQPWLSKFSPEMVEIYPNITEDASIIDYAVNEEWPQ